MMRLIVFDWEREEFLSGGLCNEGDWRPEAGPGDECEDVLVCGADGSDWYQYLITALRRSRSGPAGETHTIRLISLQTTKIRQSWDKAGLTGRLWGGRGDSYYYYSNGEKQIDWQLAGRGWQTQLMMLRVSTDCGSIWLAFVRGSIRIVLMCILQPEGQAWLADTFSNWTLPSIIWPEPL